MAELLISSITVEGGGVLEIYATETQIGETSSVTFRITTGEDWNPDYNLDLNALFLDYQDGGTSKLIADGQNSLNLNGVTYEGAKIQWDLALSSGSNAGAQGGVTVMEFSVTVNNLTLDDIDGALVGIRATSTGVDMQGSLKLVGEIDIPEPPPVDSFPDFEKDISHTILVFATTDGDTNGDGYYTVKIDDWAGSNDLDADLDAILAYLIENDPNIDASTQLVGAQIKGGNVGTAANSYDDFWAYDGDSSYTIETIPKTSGSGSTTEIVSGDVAPVDVSQPYQNQVDQTYSYDLI